ncbi:MAG: phosphatase PAP2 family protein [Bacteroidales bacterium]|nr:phosphatase PAP2 family protein [Bacteroidales bacterium]
MKKALVYIAILLLTVSCPMANAQRSDTLRCHSTHAFTWQQSIAPAALIGTGTAISFTPLHTHFDDNINNWLQHDGHPRFEVENYLQYTTLASVFILKACNIESRHNWRDLVCLEAGAALFAFSVNTGLKHALRVERPYDGVYNSFPSGHTVTAFLGAEILRREYGEEYPAIAVAGYTVATGIGVMRMYNNRHWASDVLAGAGIGILSASLMYWLAPYLTF